jgi:hypothetical protein
MSLIRWRSFLPALIFGAAMTLPRTAVADIILNYAVSGGTYSISSSALPFSGTLSADATAQKITAADLTVATLGSLTVVTSLSTDMPTFDQLVVAQNSDGTAFGSIYFNPQLLFSGEQAPISGSFSFPGSLQDMIPGGVLNVAAVPQPSTWAMMILSFCGLAS